MDKNGKEILPKDSSRVKVWKLEEKKSDVNVAVEAVFDALTDPELEQIVFVTNDTDILPALEKIKAFNDISERKVK
ncbi:NYN domain-containing protein, partial [Vibrio lentus]|nr:NYN domain-containing protein [Vibrio lentus]